MPKTPHYIADLDSATSLLYALGRYLGGKDFAGEGIAPAIPESLALALNSLSKSLRETLYRWAGWWDAIPPHKLKGVRAEEISDWIIRQYPERAYPGAMIGSSNGAAIHLCAALGIPWLPQTFLIPVRRNIHPDEIVQDLEWGRGAAREMLAANPTLQLHQMHDPVQDRMMLPRMGYFRIKLLGLGGKLEEFLTRSLCPGATLFLLECNLNWPITRVAERHYFQTGGLGDTSPREYLYGSPRVERFLTLYESHLRRWVAPEPTEEGPEAEWGFVPELGEDVRRLARERGYRVRRVIFNHPEDLSPFVADLHAWWYRRRGRDAGRLLVESFALLEPYWALRTASVPFWLVFNTGASANAIDDYLDRAERFDEIYMMLLSNCVHAIGLAPIERWKEILNRARRRGAFVGVDEREFPRDLATFIRYHTDLKKRISARYDLPRPLGLEELDQFLLQGAGDYSITLKEGR